MEQFTAAMGFGGALAGDDFVDRGRREITFVTSSDHPHSNGNVVISEGIDWRDYASNPLLLLGHEGGERDWRALPLGKWTARRSTKLPDGMPGVMCRAKFANEEQVSKGSDAWHLADSVYRMALPENGIVNQTSISWTAHEALAPKAIRHQSGLVGKYFQKSNMIEQSIVLIPANTKARRVDAGPEALIKQAASAQVITGDEATLLGRYVGVVRPYEVAGLGATERLSGVDMPGVGGWVPFQAERLVSASDGTLRSVAQVAEPARSVASAAAGAGEEPEGGAILSSSQKASDATPAARSRLGAQRIHLDRAHFPTREAAAAWLQEHAFDAAPGDLNEMRSAWGYHPKDGPFVGPPVDESLDQGVTAILRQRDPHPPRASAAAPAREALTLERYLSRSAKAADRAAIVRAAAAAKSLSRALFLETSPGEPAEMRRNLETAALLSRDVADALGRLVANPAGNGGACTYGEDEEEKKKGMRASTRAAFGKGPDDEEEDDDEEDNGDDESTEEDDEKREDAALFEKKKDDDEEDDDEEEKEDDEKSDKPPWLKKKIADKASRSGKKRKKTPERAAVAQLERAAMRVGELLTIARRSRQDGSPAEVKSDAPAVDPKAQAYKAAHDRIQALLAARRAPTAPGTPQGGEQTAGDASAGAVK